MKTDICQSLVDLSHELGKPEHELVILGEGNTSGGDMSKSVQ